MLDRERLIHFRGDVFKNAIAETMRVQRISINRLAAETFVPYQTCWRMVSHGDVRNIEALWSVGVFLGLNAADYIEGRP